MKNELQKRGKGGKGKGKRTGGAGDGGSGDEDGDDDEQENEEDMIKKAQSQLEEEKKALLENHSMMAGVILNLFCLYYN